MLVHYQTRPQGDYVVGLQQGLCCWCPPLLHWTSLHVIGFLVSSEYPSGFVFNDGHSLSQYMILFRLCQISPTTLLVPRFLSVAPLYYLQVFMVQGTCSVDQNPSSELAVFLSALSELHWGRTPLALARYS